MAEYRLRQIGRQCERFVASKMKHCNKTATHEVLDSRDTSYGYYCEVHAYALLREMDEPDPKLQRELAKE